MKATPIESGPLAELMQSQQREIAEFKRIESEKAGRDIGWQLAADHWFEKYFADWVRDQRCAIDQVLANADPRVPAGAIGSQSPATPLSAAAAASR